MNPPLQTVQDRQRLLLEQAESEWKAAATLDLL